MFTIEYVKDLKWDNEQHTSFSCVVKYAEFDEEHPSGIHPNDPYAHIQEIWVKGIAGEYGVIAEADRQPTFGEIPVVDVSA